MRNAKSLPSPFKYRNGYRAQVTNPTTRRRETKDFASKRDAQNWICEQVHAIAVQSDGRLGGPSNCTLAEFLQEYACTVSVLKNGYTQEVNRINCYLEAADMPRLKVETEGKVRRVMLNTQANSEAMTAYLEKVREPIEAIWELKAQMAHCLCSDLTRDDFAELMSQMATHGNSTSTTQKEIALVRAAFNTAIEDWGWSSFENPAAKLKLGSSRTVIPKFSNKDIEVLFSLAESEHHLMMAPLVRLAVETLIRKKQLINLTWSDIDFERKQCEVKIKKSALKGVEVTHIPLSDKAMNILTTLKSNSSTDKVFGDLTLDKVANMYQNISKKMGKSALRFHDLRHVGATLCARAGMSAHQLRLMLGHKTIHMALVYVNLSSQDIQEFIESVMAGSILPETKYENTHHALQISSAACSTPLNP